MHENSIMKYSISIQKSVCVFANPIINTSIAQKPRNKTFKDWKTLL